MSIVLKLQVGKAQRVLRGADHVWRVMREIQAAGELITVAEIHARSNDHRSAIGKYVRELVSRGFVEEAGDTAHCAVNAEKSYRIIRDQASAPRLSKSGAQRSGQQNMWNVLRGPMGREGINARDLAAFAATNDVPILLGSAQAYTRTLAQAGYLVPLAKGGPGRLTVWRLKPSMNTGPLPPMILRSKMVYDQNADKVMGDVIAEEDRP